MKNKWRKRSKNSQLGRAGLFVFFLLFFAMGSLFLYLMFLRPMLAVYAAEGWVETPCTIESSGVETHHDSDGSTYSVAISFSYTHAGRSYRSDRYSFETGSSSGHQGKREIVDRHPVGSQAVCYVDPENPYEAVMHRGLVSSYLWMILPLIFVFIGLGGMLFALGVFGGGAGTRTSKVREWLPEVRETDQGSEYGFRGAPDLDRETVLKSDISPLAKLIGISIFALIWNGIVSIFVVEVVSGWLNGNPSYFETIFMLPFLIVGLVTIGAVVYFALAMFNARPTLTASRAATRLGDELDLRWTLSGTPENLQRLTITLEGTEEATYARGTNSVTDTETFMTLPILETENQTQMGRGSVTLRIPPDSMHSFESDHNKIKWTFKVAGDVRRWPDISETFPYVILPRGYSVKGGRS